MNTQIAPSPNPIELEKQRLFQEAVAEIGGISAEHGASVSLVYAAQKLAEERWHLFIQSKRLKSALALSEQAGELADWTPQKLDREIDDLADELGPILFQRAFQKMPNARGRSLPDLRDDERCKLLGLLIAAKLRGQR